MQNNVLFRNGTAWFYVFLCVGYTAFYLSNPALPGNNIEYPLGWWGWWDQGKYIGSAQALVARDFSAAAHWYPMGFSLLASVFVPFLPNHPFYFVGLGSLLLSAGLFVRICGILNVNRIVAAVLFLLALFHDRLIFTQFVIPWNTSPIVVYVYAALYLVLRTESPRLLAVCGAAACAALTLVTRPGDLTTLAPIGIALAVRLVLEHPPAIWLRYALAGVATLVLIVALYGALHVAIFGFGPSPYMAMSGALGVTSEFFAQKLYAVVIDPKPLYGEGQGLIQRAGWLALAIPALVLSAVVSGWRWVLIAAVVLVNICFYTAYADFLPHGIWKYYNIHYLKLSYPLFALAAFNGVRICVAKPKATVVFAALVLMLMAIRFEMKEYPVAQVTVESDKALSFTCGECKAARVFVIRPANLNYAQIYFAENRARIGDVTYRNIYDFRTIPVDDTIRTIFPVMVAGQPVQLSFVAEHGYRVGAPPQVTALSGRFRMRLPRLP